jgi:excisionase family DNA binding protein
MAKTRNKKPEKPRKPVRAKPRGKRASLPRSYLTVSQAADQLQMTPGGVYAAIRRGDLPAKRIAGRIAVARADVRAFHHAKLEWLRLSDPNRPLTDEEFLQRLWDSDPD